MPRLQLRGLRLCQLAPDSQSAIVEFRAVPSFYLVLRGFLASIATLAHVPWPTNFAGLNDLPRQLIGLFCIGKRLTHQDRFLTALRFPSDDHSPRTPRRCDNYRIAGLRGELLRGSNAGGLVHQLAIATEPNHVRPAVGRCDPRLFTFAKFLLD
jgi:hypothetical protein